MLLRAQILTPVARHATTRIFNNGKDTQRARHALPPELHEKAGQLLDRIAAATSPADLRVPRANRLHQLKEDREAQWSVSINDQYRICVAWEDGRAVNVEITDYH